MVLDEYAPDDSNLNEENKRLIRKFRLQEPEAAKQSVVYGIYDRKSGDLLYIGETRALIRRVSDHLRTRDDKNILGLVEADPEIEIEGGYDGNIWDRIAVKYVQVTGDRRRRKKIEAALEEELSPRYPSE